MSCNFNRLYKLMTEEQLDALLITDKINWRYLCGFTGSNGLLIVTPAENTLLIDGRYTEQASQQTHSVAICTINEKENIWQAAAKILSDKTRIGFEKNTLNYGSYHELQNYFDANTQLLPTENLVEQLRMIKTNDEIQQIQKAANLGDKTYEYLLTIIKPGMTELELANEIDYYSKKIGSDGPAFETIVASGNRTALPHAHASHKIIEKNELIMIDFGCIVEGYYSDMTRTFALGEVSDEIKQRYQLLLESQKKAITAIKIGEPLSKIDSVARQYLAKSGQETYFTHGLGHGIGLSCHEYPYLNQLSREIIQPQMVFTIEPGIYYEKKYGIRIEDDIFINDQGEPVILTKSNKEWTKISWS